jgi:hypothetical protein
MRFQGKIKYIQRTGGSALSKEIYIVGTLVSIVLSLLLFASGRRNEGIFVGLWAPTIMELGRALGEED